MFFRGTDLNVTTPSWRAHQIQMEYGSCGSKSSSPVTGEENDSSRELLTSNPSPVLNELSNQDAFESEKSQGQSLALDFLLSSCWKMTTLPLRKTVVAQMLPVLQAGSRQAVTKCWTREIKTPKGFGAFVSCTSRLTLHYESFYSSPEYQSFFSLHLLKTTQTLTPKGWLHSLSSSCC